MEKETIQSLMEKGYSGLQAMQILDWEDNDLTIDDLCTIGKMYNIGTRGKKKHE